MVAAGLTPDTVTYTGAISACGRGGRGGQALALYGEMGRRGAAPNEVTYAAVVSACWCGADRAAAGSGQLVSVMATFQGSAVGLLRARSREAADAGITASARLS